MNYNLEMKKIILNSRESRRENKILLHVCCGPCSTSVVEVLRQEFKVVTYFYNPNIYPREEYLRRKEEAKNYLLSQGIEFIEGEFEEEVFKKAFEGFEKCEEGGARCQECFGLRLGKTAEKALEIGADLFGTTLTVSPHKDVKIINEIGITYETSDLKYLPSDFKKENGYLRSLELAKNNRMYRQNYCGCKFSMRGIKSEI